MTKKELNKIISETVKSIISEADSSALANKVTTKLYNTKEDVCANIKSDIRRIDDAVDELKKALPKLFGKDSTNTMNFYKKVTKQVAVLAKVVDELDNISLLDSMK